MDLQIGSGHHEALFRTMRILHGTAAVTSSSGSTVGIRFTMDGAALATTCTIVRASEHLIVLEPDDDTDVPPLGAMVELDIGRRTYRSTVQHHDARGFTVLRPRELDHLAGRIDLVMLDEL